jgi:hypothetical protein
METNAQLIDRAAQEVGEDEVSVNRLEAMQALAKLTDEELIMALIGGVAFLSRNKGVSPLAALEAFTNVAGEILTLSMVAAMTGIDLDTILGGGR